MNFVTPLSPGIFNAIKFIAEYLWFDHFIHWFRSKLKRAAYVRKIIDGNPIPIQDVVDHSFEEASRSILALFQAPFRRLRKERNEENRRALEESERPRRKSFRVWFCRFFLQLLPPLTLVGLFLLEYATDTTAKCMLHEVKLGSARTNIGVLVSAFTCGLIRQESVKVAKRSTPPKSEYLVSYTDSYLLGNQIVCGCSDWKTENCVQSYNGTHIETPSEASWRSSVRLSRIGSLKMLNEVRAMVNSPKYFRWETLRNNALRSFVSKNGGFLDCFSGKNNKQGTQARVDACAYKPQRNITFADVLIIAQSGEDVSLVYYAIPVRTGDDLRPKLRGIVDGPTHTFRGIPVIYTAKSKKFSTLPPMKFVLASLELLVHFDIRYTLANEGEGVVLSHAIVLMLSVYTRLQPKGRGMWKKCNGNVMFVSPTGYIAVAVVIIFTAIALLLALITTPERLFRFLLRGRSFESSRWAVNSMMSEKFGTGTCFTGKTINGDIVLKRYDDEFHISIVPPGAATVKCTAEDIPNIHGTGLRPQKQD